MLFNIKKKYIKKKRFATRFECTYGKCVYVRVCVCMSVIAVTRQDVENLAVHVVRPLERSTDGPQRGGVKERQKGVEG